VYKKIAERKLKEASASFCSMNTEAQKRRHAAYDITDCISNLAQGVLLIGSVAYAPDAVSPASDLDMVGVFDFPKTDFQELYRRLGRTYEPLVAEYAHARRANTVSIVWNVPDFEIGLHLWDTTALEKVSYLRDHNVVFARNDSLRHFRSTAIRETRYNLEGQPKIFEKPFQEVEGGKLVNFYPFWEDESGFYPGIQFNNLLLNPTILYEGSYDVSFELIRFQHNLQEKFRRYGGNRDKQRISLYNALDPKIKAKVPESLRMVLTEVY